MSLVLRNIRRYLLTESDSVFMQTLNFYSDEVIEGEELNWTLETEDLFVIAVS